MELRDYQVAAVDKARQAVREGFRSILLVSPTGSGKTVMLSQFVKNHIERGGTVNWFAHRRELIAQAVETLSRFGVTNGVNVLSVQAAVISGEVPACSLAVFDEAHHFGRQAELWHTLADAHKAGFILGATATPERGDGTPLSPPFEKLIVVAQVPELIARGYLTPVDVFCPAVVLKGQEIAKTPVEEYLSRGLRGKRNVVFAPNVKSAEIYAEQFAAAGIEALVVHGAMQKDDRIRALGRLRSGDVHVIVNVYVLTEGWDCPEVEVVTLARSIGSCGVYLQMVGRGMRPAEGKSRCTLLDLVAGSREFGRPDELREFSLTGQPISKKAKGPLGLCPVCSSDREPGEACAVCGYEYVLPLPVVIGIDTDRYGHIRTDPPAAKAHRIANWIRDARAKGHKIFSVKHKIKAVYGAFPTSEEWSHSLTLATLGTYSGKVYPG